MKKTLISLLVIIFTSSLIAQKMDGKKFHDLTTDFETPHLKWAEKLSQDKLKVLFILSLSSARHIVEAAQRFDITTDAITTTLRNREYMLGITKDSDGYCGRLYEGTSETDKSISLAKKLETTYDVILLDQLNFNKLSNELKFKLLMQVKKGTGLVVFRSKNLPKPLFKNAIADAGKKITILANSFVASSIKAYQFGKGKIVLCKTIQRTNSSDSKAKVFDDIIPAPFRYTSPAWWADYENGQVFFLRTLLWAADRVPAVNINSPFLDKHYVLEQKEQNIPLSIKASKPGKLIVRLRNEFNKIVKTGELSYQEQINNLTFRLPELSSGNYYLDLIANDNTGTENFGFYSFRVKSPIIAELITRTDSIKGFSPIHATLKLNKALKKGTAIISLMDSPYERIWYQKEINIDGKTEIPIVIKDYYMPNLAAFLTVSVKADNQPVCSAVTTFYFPVYQTKLPLYMDTQWEYNPGGTDILRSMAEAGAMGNTGIWNRIDGTRPNVQTYMLLNQRLMAHCMSVTSTDIDGARKYFNDEELSDLDKKAFAKKSFAPDDVSDQRKRLMVEAVFRNKQLRSYPLATYGMGNEVNVPYKNKFTPEDNQTFIKMLKQEYGTIEKLNEEWGRKYKSFEDVPHLNLTEAREKKLYPEYLAHARYVNKTVARYIKVASDEVNKRTPNAKIGCDGVWTGNNSGFNMEDILSNKNINTWGPYTRLPQLEILRSIRPDLHHLTVWGWIMSNEALPEAPWFNLLIGTCNEISWFISGTSAGGVKLSADYTPFRPKMEQELEKLRTGTAQLLISTKLKSDGIAIWENYNSTIACQLGDQRFIQSIESSMAIINFCYQNGLNFDYIVKNTLDKLKGYKVLFLCGASSIGNVEKQAILKFVENGGIVIADMNPGMMNDSYKILEKNQLSKLFGVYNPQQSPKPVNKNLEINTTFNKQKIELQATDALTTPGIKPFSIHKFGKGQAVLLNFSLGSAKIGSDNKQFNTFMLNILVACKIKTDLKITNLPQDSVIRIREGDGFELIGFTNRRLAKSGKNGENVTVTLPEKRYIYEVDSGLLKHSNSFTFKFAPAFKLFSAFDHEQSAPKIKLSSKTAKPGTPLILDISSLPKGRIMRLQVFDKEGKNILYRNEAVTHEVFETDGKMIKKLIHFAYNYPKGNYKINLTDIATGLNSSETITLK